MRPLHYSPNGTGRDSYIATTNGGFTSVGNNQVAMDPRIIFKNNLRTYQPDDSYLQRRGHAVKNSWK